MRSCLLTYLALSLVLVTLAQGSLPARENPEVQVEDREPPADGERPQLS